MPASGSMIGRRACMLPRTGRALVSTRRRPLACVSITRRTVMRTSAAKPSDVPEAEVEAATNGAKSSSEPASRKATKSFAGKSDMPAAESHQKAAAPEKRSAAPSAITGDKASGKDDVTGPLLEPSIFNTNAVRALAITAGVVLAASSTQFFPSRVTSFIHLIAYAVFLGTNIWNTFFVGLTLFKLVPRQMFGKVQAKLFPLYFGVTTSTAVVLLGTLMFSPAAVPASVLATLGLGIVCGLVNWGVVEPICVKYLFERYDIENKEKKEEGDEKRIKELYKQFGKWHGISSLLNLVVLVIGFAHGWHLTSAFVA